GKRRVAKLPPRVIAALAELPHREGRVFRHQRGDYTVGEHRAGGEFRSAWLTAIRRAGLDPKFTPHVCRHTWATWHYALNKDLLGLKAEGGWGSVSMVERYAKLMPAGYEGEIRRFLGDECDRIVTDLDARSLYWHQAPDFLIRISSTLASSMPRVTASVE